MIRQEYWYKESQGSPQVDLVRLEVEIDKGILDHLESYIILVYRVKPDGYLKDRLNSWRNDIYLAFADDDRVMGRRYGPSGIFKYLSGEAGKIYGEWGNLYRRQVADLTDLEDLRSFLKFRYEMIYEKLPILKKHLENQLK